MNREKDDDMRLLEYAFTRVLFAIFFGSLGARGIAIQSGNPLLGEKGGILFFVFVGVFVGSMLHSLYWKEVRS